jgi:hypothetical protein
MQADRGWRQLEQVAATLRAGSASIPLAGGPLWGAARIGSAAPHYRTALQQARSLAQEHHEALVASLRRTGAQLCTEMPGLRRAWQPMLDELEQGAHATEHGWPTPQTVAELDQINLLDARWLANAAMFESRARRHEGDQLGAVGITLDAATFARDFVQRSVLIQRMIGGAALAIVIKEAWHAAALHELGPEALRRLGNGLERLDQELPEALDLRDEMLFLITAVQRAEPTAAWLPTPHWRYGFSSRWMLADAVVQTAQAVDELTRAAELRWPQRQALIEQEFQALLNTGNPALATITPNYQAAERGWRETIAELRLLRMAVAFELGFDLPPLRDPLGNGPLEVQRDAAQVVVRSAGSTGPRRIERIVPR